MGRRRIRKLRTRSRRHRHPHLAYNAVSARRGVLLRAQLAQAQQLVSRHEKLKVIIPVTIVLGISFALMASAPVGRAIVGAVWLAHLVYFGLIVKTDRDSLANAA